MDAEENFILISSLLCEASRAKMLWNLLDGRAYTASELAIVADISPTSASNHLSKMLEADLIKVERQGRHKYFSFSRPEVAYVVESLASLGLNDSAKGLQKEKEVKGVKFCRTCYDHMAGYVGVKITEAFEMSELIEKSETEYIVTEKGWAWLSDFEILKDEVERKRRPIARQCLDWSERRPHLAGQLGALLLEKMLNRLWFRRVRFSRELVITSTGQQKLRDLLNLNL